MYVPANYGCYGDTFVVVAMAMPGDGDESHLFLTPFSSLMKQVISIG